MENSDIKLLSVKQAAEFIGVSVPTIRRWAQQKKLIGLKVGSRGDWRFTQDELLQLVKKTAGSTMQIHPQKLSQIRDLLLRDADIIQRLASEHHKEYLGRKGIRNVPLDRYIQNHIAVVNKLADNLTVEDIKKGTEQWVILNKQG